MKYKAYLFVFALSFGASMQCMDEPLKATQNENLEEKSQLYKSYERLLQLSKDYATSFAINQTGLFIHEIGHALTAKLLLDIPVDIRMGGLGEPIAKVPGLPISLGGYNPLIACAMLRGDTLAMSSYYDACKIGLQLTTVFAAGPICGLLFHSLILKYTSYKKTALIGLIDHSFNLCPIDLGFVTTDGHKIQQISTQLKSLLQHEMPKDALLKIR